MKIGFIILAYLIGSIPTGYWLGKVWKGIDVRQFGSGNLGATNVFRVLGKVPGAITLAVDILKGVVVVLLAEHLFPGQSSLAISAGLAAIIGHTTSPFAGFRGGKGVATSGGVCLALMPLPSVFAFTAFALCLIGTRYVSASSIAAGLTLAIAAFVFSPDPLARDAAYFIAILILWTHRSNLQRLAHGTEHRIDWKGAA